MHFTVQLSSDRKVHVAVLGLVCVCVCRQWLAGRACSPTLIRCADSNKVIQLLRVAVSVVPPSARCVLVFRTSPTFRLQESLNLCFTRPMWLRRLDGENFTLTLLTLNSIRRRGRIKSASLCDPVWSVSAVRQGYLLMV